MAKDTFKLDTQSKHQVVAQERLFLTADGKRVVKEGDKEAAILLAAVGHPIPIATAKRLGLVADEAKGVDPETRATRPAAAEHKR